VSTTAPPPARSRWTDPLDRASLVLFALLCGAVGMTGVAAAIAFPTMKALGPTLGAYPMYHGVHWTLAAGEVMRRVFAVSDIVMIVCAVLAALALSGAFAIRIRRARPSPTQWVRVLLALALLGVIGYQAMSLRPRMNTELLAYLDAAQVGDAATADFHRANFSALHPSASRTLGATFLLAGASCVLGVFSRRDA